MSEVAPNRNLEVDYDTVCKIIKSDGKCAIKVNNDCKNVVMIDVRPADEIEANGGMIPCARNLPCNHTAMVGPIYFIVNEIESALTNLDERQFESKYGYKKPNKANDCLLFYCKLGGRARKALDLCQSLGYSTACYPGSWTEWQAKQGH